MNKTLQIFTSLTISFIIMRGANYFFFDKRIDQTLLLDSRQNEPTFIDLSKRDSSSISNHNIRVFVDDKNGDILKVETLQEKENIDSDEMLQLVNPSKEGRASHIRNFFKYSEGKNENWKIESKSPTSITLSNQISAGVMQFKTISIENDCIILVKNKVVNDLDININVELESQIIYNDSNKSSLGIHKGFIGNIDGKKEELDLKKLEKKKLVNTTLSSWFGVTDRHLLCSISLNHPSEITTSKNQDQYTISSNSKTIEIKPKSSQVIDSYIYSGLKKQNLLQKYKYAYNLKDFESSIDFGMFSFFTIPLMNFYKTLVGWLNSFILAIFLLSLIIKLLFAKSDFDRNKKQKQIQALQPKINKIKAIHEDALTQYQEINKLYKKEGIDNDMLGMLGSLALAIVQPILFFAMYKVLNIYTDIRHESFLWVKDLGNKDLSSVFTLFGLIKIKLPDILQVGALPFIQTIMIYLQFGVLNPNNPNDSEQPLGDTIKMMKYFTPFMLILIKDLPAILIIYYIISSALSTTQNFIFKKIENK